MSARLAEDSLGRTCCHARSTSGTSRRRARWPGRILGEGGSDMPAREELPATLRRSPRGAQETWIKAHDSAVDSYGEGERAHRVAYSALKHTYEKVGDRWRPKEEKGPSDKQAVNPRAPKQRGGDKPTAGGADTSATKKHLYKRSREVSLSGRSKMHERELVDALGKASRTRTRQSRSS